MNMEITIVKTFCDSGHNVFKKQPLWLFFIRILVISSEKNLATLRNAGKQVLYIHVFCDF